MEQMEKSKAVLQLLIWTCFFLLLPAKYSYKPWKSTGSHLRGILEGGRGG